MKNAPGQRLGRKRIMLMISIVAILLAIFLVFFQKVPEQQVLHDRNGFFQQYEKTVSELMNNRAASSALPDIPSGLLTSHVMSLALHYSIDPEVHSSTAEMLELSIARADPEAVIQWLALLRVNYQLHISSIRITLSDDKKRVSIPELSLVKASF